MTKRLGAPDADLGREAYARFGAAYYLSECLHRELCNAYVIAPFVTSAGITGPRIDERMTEAFSMTLGQLVEALRPSVTPELHERLSEAAERRNFLAHRFWFERAHMLFADADLEALIGELQQHQAFFQAVDEEASAYFVEGRRRLGISDAHERAALAEIMTGEEWCSLPTQRRLRKVETIVRVWEVPLGGGQSTLILETDDEALWQLSDVGLGWTRYAQPGPNWRENIMLKPHLPARVNSRPGASGSWRYEFVLKHNVRLWVRLSDKRQHSFVWGIREKEARNRG